MHSGKKPFDFTSNSVLHEGPGFIVVAKPAGLPTQGTPDPRRDHLFAAVQRWRASMCGRGAYVGLHHRLDRDTSGLVLFTTERQRNIWASKLFQQRLITKSYLAICRRPVGSNLFINQELVVENYLAKNSKTKPARMHEVHSGGDRAATTFKILELKPDRILIEAIPHTGRMHQIRVHLEKINFPICGDPVYNKSSGKLLPLAIPPPRRLMLHAARLEFPDPVTDAQRRVESPLPTDMQEYWNQ